VNTGESPELVQKKGKKREKIIAMVARKEYDINNVSIFKKVTSNTMILAQNFS
jgi:hypothetical protein